jgi:ankyrin repeat protein
MNRSKEPILHKFCKKYDGNQDLNIITLLVQKGVNINKVDCELITCLHYACENGSIPLVIKLLDNNADITKKDIYDNTILHYTCGYNNLDLLKYLLNKYKNFNITQKNDSDYTVLHYACDFNNYEMVKIILDYDSSIINCKTKFGKNALQLTNNKDIINLIESYTISNDENISCNIDNLIITKKQKF